MTFDDLITYPLFVTEVSCSDGKFGVLHGTDPDTKEAVVAVHRERSYRLIPAREIEVGTIYLTPLEIRNKK